MTEELISFRAFPKIKRLTKFNPLEVTITEKIDGTNGCVVIENGELSFVQSRNRIITPDDDNYGFAKWAWANKDALASFGNGYHYGEWAGEGIQGNPRGLTGKVFYLFNTYKYENMGEEKRNSLPPNCSPVPTVGSDLQEYSNATIHESMNMVQTWADYYHYKPEGIMVFFHNFGTYMKHTFDNPEGKWVGVS